MSFSFFQSVGSVVKDGLSHSTLLSHIDVVSLLDVSGFPHSDILKLYTGNNLLKAIKDKPVGLSLQLKARADMC